MNTTSLEKQKKGNLYVYKFGGGSKTPEYHPPSAAAVTKRIISSSIWGLRKSKSKPKNGKNQDNEMSNNMEEVGHATKVRDLVKGRFAGDLLGNNNERKSVSSVEAILLSLANGKITEERKSNSHNNSVNERKGQECVKGKILMEETRKSVSHVENNMAYVGKFMEKPRKSTGVKLETNLENCVALLQVKVLVTDMPGFMQVHAFQCARNTYDSLEKFSAKHLASNLKKEFDKIYGPAWHCIVGSSFGSFVTHATGCFLYFSMEKLCILLFRTKVARAVQK